MIKNFRTSINTLASKILLGFLAIAFIFLWGGQEGLRMIGVGKSNTIAKVASDRITVQEFNRHLGFNLAVLSNQLGRDITPEQVRQYGIDRQTLETLIQQKLIDKEVSRLKIYVSDAHVATDIQSQGVFKDAQGAFDKEVFLGRIRELGFPNERSYVEARRGEIARQWLIQSMTGLVTTPQVSVAPLHSWQNQTRRGIAMVVGHDAIVVPSPDEDTFRDYFGKNRGRFKLQEERDAKLLLVDVKKLKKTAHETVKDSDVESLYAVEKTQRFKDMPREEALKKIRTELEATELNEKLQVLGQEIQEKYAQGVDFETLGKTYGRAISSLDNTRIEDGQSNLVGQTDNFKMALYGGDPMALHNLIFETELDAMSPLIPFNKEWAVMVVVTAIHEPRFPTFQEAFERGSLSRDYFSNRRDEVRIKIIKQISEKLKEGGDFRELARKNRLRLVEYRLKNDGETKMIGPYQLSADSIARLFQVPVGGVTVAEIVHARGDQVKLLTLVEGVSYPNEENRSTLSDFSLLLKSHIESDLVETYLSYLRQKYPVEINQNLFKVSN